MRPRILRYRVEGWTDPECLFTAEFASSDRAFWLDSGLYAETGMSYLGVGVATVTAESGAGHVRHSERGRIEGSVFDFLRVETGAQRGAAVPGHPLGWVGWLGYELRHDSMGTRPDTRHRAAAGPVDAAAVVDAAVVQVDRAVAFDHASRTVELIAIGDEWSGDLAGWRDAMLERIADLADADAGAVGVGAVDVGAVDVGAVDVGAVDVGQPFGEAGPPTSAALHIVGAVAIWRDTDEAYLAKIGACLEAIREGEAYQLCLTTEVSVDRRPDPAEVWLRLRASSPSHHGAFLRIGDTTLLSTSPETFLTITPGGVVESRPIKGTRPRGTDPADDLRLRAELLHSEKERAENLMIVDLMRNDLGRVCEVGSVSVPSLLAVESYAHVHQLVSRVRGTIAASLGPIDAVEACFPAGSMTGAPKRRATELLDALERRDRGLYAGAFGWFGVDGSVELAMTIRSIVLRPDGATVGAGGGITASSVPVEELAEAKLKAAALLAVLGVGAQSGTPRV
ncbi:MAG: anthranilate synthase component I family protein [Burkholderiaceae bacterium]|nr:anthranilate synthase component I family protein [Microbacteriaceae bacterium]